MLTVLGVWLLVPVFLETDSVSNRVVINRLHSNQRPLVQRTISANPGLIISTTCVLFTVNPKLTLTIVSRGDWLWKPSKSMMKTRVLTVETSGTRTVSSWCKQSNLIYHSMRQFFNDLFLRLGRIVIEGDFDLHTRAASKYDDRRVIHLPAFKIWWVQGRVLGRIYQSQYRRPVSPVGRAPVFWAGGREFKPWPDQYPRSYGTTSCKNTLRH